MNQLSKNTVLFCSVACILSLSYLIYNSILDFGFLTGWDDGWQVINKYTETWSPDNFKSILTDYYYGQYSPANQAIYTLIYHFFGYRPGVFHLMCLALHAGNSILVFFIIKRLLSTNNVETPKSTVISLSVALLFAAHPLQVESVAWISASKILVYSFFYLWALWFYFAYIRRKNIFWYMIMIVCFIVSFGGKEQAITFPVCLLWIDLACRRNFRGWKVWIEKIPVFLLTVFFVYITFQSYHSSLAGLLERSENYPFIHRIVFTCYSFCEYIIKTFVPFNFLYIYPYPMLAGEPLPFKFWLYPFIMLIIALAFWKFWRQRPVWLAVFWFLIHTALMLHIFPLTRANIVADRYVYLALPGILFIVVRYFLVFWETKPKLRSVLAGAGLIWVLLICVPANQRTHIWRDDASLKEKLNLLLQERKGELEQKENESPK